MTADSRPGLLSSTAQELLDAALGGYFGWAGLRLLEIAPGRGRATFRPRPEMLTPWGTLNGGVLNGLVEFPSFVALLTTLEAGELAVTNDVFLQHLRPLPGAVDYVLEGRLLRRGRSMAWTDVTVSAEGKVITLARITKSIVPRPPSGGDPVLDSPARD